MTRKKGGKSVSFDAMVKFFMQHYDLPTKKDFNKLLTKIDRLETLIKKQAVLSGKGRQIYGTGSIKSGRINMTASDIVLEVVKRSKKGVDFNQLQSKTGFEDKKLRNIIFRLNKLKKIKRKNRGIYIIA
ncbi:MAG: hypothetical protein HN931_05700 [Desulfobacterales bacterium]|jgi:hypothetical protein|nr:hypothetical protein [Desulfobacteraceae bacterium]MBT4364382.1 hypothetical protein [Desulfobacteraceae bacterium]MBT7085649.1 hypothetical protein [Desulfobacterales bacterium]